MPPSDAPTAPARPAARSRDRGHAVRHPANGSTPRPPRDADGHADQGSREGTGSRSAAEWVTLAISALIVLGIVGLATAFSLTGSSAPAVVEVVPRLAETFEAGGRYYLPIRIRNVGGQTGEEVRVRVTVADPQGRAETAELQIQFLAGGSASRAVAAFGSDPRQGQVEAVVVSYLER